MLDRQVNRNPKIDPWGTPQKFILEDWRRQKDHLKEMFFKHLKLWLRKQQEREL